MQSNSMYSFGDEFQNCPFQHLVGQCDCNDLLGNNSTGQMRKFFFVGSFFKWNQVRRFSSSSAYVKTDYPDKLPKACMRKLTLTQLRELYDIPTLPDIDLAVKTANAAAYAIHTYLEKTPIPQHTRQAFAEFIAWRQRPDARETLFVDAGCGHGWSTVRLARQFPNCDVVGVDRSGVKLSRNAAFRHGGIPRDTPNALLLRADLVHFWRLCWQHKILPHRQYLLYPNPYPKKGHLKVSNSSAFSNVAMNSQSHLRYLSRKKKPF